MSAATGGLHRASDLSCCARNRSRCSIRSSIVSTWPNIIVALEFNPSRCATSMTSSQSLLIALSGETFLRTRSTRISPPPPGIEPSPGFTKSPMKNPSIVVLPARYCSSGLGFAAIISPMIFSSGSLNTSRKWMNSLGLKPWMLTCGHFVLMCESKSRYHCFVSLG